MGRLWAEEKIEARFVNCVNTMNEITDKYISNRLPLYKPNNII